MNNDFDPSEQLQSVEQFSAHNQTEKLPPLSKAIGYRPALSPELKAVLDAYEPVPYTQAIPASPSSIEETLKQRGNRYGDFGEHARITQNIKSAMVDSPNWQSLPPNMKEALEMIAHKAGRILNGDPYYHDSWHDIVGYTKLVADELPH